MRSKTTCECMYVCMSVSMYRYVYLYLPVNTCNKYVRFNYV